MIAQIEWSEAVVMIINGHRTPKAPSPPLEAPGRSFLAARSPGVPRATSPCTRVSTLAKLVADFNGSVTWSPSVQ